jgi:DNA-binding NarL/FixJ family response regulator
MPVTNMNIRVAIFEDGKLIRDAYEAILNGTEGYICVGSFADCNSLDLCIRKSNPDVVLMDIEMPGTDGIQATGFLSNHYPDIRILIQTVFEEDEKIFAAVCAGASGYILKNNGLSKLLEAVTEVYNGGSPMSPTVASRVLKLFQQFAPQPNLSNDLHLSPREKEILSMMVDGNDFHTIAEKNFISYETVRTHVKKIYKKLHVASASEAVAKAIKQRLV